MTLWQNIPFFSILLPLGSAAVTSVLKPRPARVWATLASALVTAASALLLARMLAWGESYTYMMGHYPAPWGNEIRAGVLEAATALFFSAVLLLSQLGGLRKQQEHILPDKQPLYAVMLLLLLSALMAQTYTNDSFTAYVFLEIMTIAACSLMTARTDGHTLVAATRYMILNLIGSGLFLLGLTVLYALTGHLLMSPMQEAVHALYLSGEYHLPLQIVVGLMTVGLGVKSALFPFHAWVPDAYSYATPTSQAALSSLVCKGYIFLLMKVYIRVLGVEVLSDQHMVRLLFLFALAGMILGSVQAVRQKDMRRMIAYSSVAQIGYIYMGLGLGTEAGFRAAMFHLLAHGLCKSMLFLATDALTPEGRYDLAGLRGSGYRCPVAGVAFTAGALGMVGFPFLPGFTSKINFALAGVGWGGAHMWLVFGGLVISTLLNTVYFLRAMIAVWRRPEEPAPRAAAGGACAVSLAALTALNLLLGVFSQRVLDVLTAGLRMFG